MLDAETMSGMLAQAGSTGKHVWAQLAVNSRDAQGHVLLSAYL